MERQKIAAGRLFLLLVHYEIIVSCFFSCVCACTKLRWSKYVTYQFRIWFRVMDLSMFHVVWVFSLKCTHGKKNTTVCATTKRTRKRDEEFQIWAKWNLFIRWKHTASAASQYTCMCLFNVCLFTIARLWTDKIVYYFAKRHAKKRLDRREINQIFSTLHTNCNFCVLVIFVHINQSQNDIFIKSLRFSLQTGRFFTFSHNIAHHFISSTFILKSTQTLLRPWRVKEGRIVNWTTKQ